jgi:sialate O-acetylesterase
MSMTRRLFLGLALVLGLVVPALAQEGLRLAAIFSDNMVLQRDVGVPVWGWAGAGEQVTVSFLNQKKTATAGADGRWMVKLDSLSAGGPHDLTVTGRSSISLRNVLVGEVWICSGQSNMEWSLSNTENPQPAIDSSRNPMLRLYTVKKNRSSTPLDNCEGQWAEASPDSTPRFSAVGYYFGRYLQKELDVPVGLIHTSWGGTPIEAWTSRAVMAGDPEMKVILDAFPARQQAYEAGVKRWEEQAAAARQAGREAPRRPGQPWEPGSLYNAMIAPLVPYAVNGAIWYQGESNAGNPTLYRRQMPAMIQQWRTEFGSGEWPFLIVSLANYMARKPEPADSNWAELREAQAMATTALPKVGIAMAIDIGDEKDIHPRNKKDVGERLALNALAIGYGRNIVHSGPVFDSIKVEDGRARLGFRHLGGGLVAKDGPLKGFAIAGEDRRFVWADARIDGDTIIVSSPQVARPVAVRYAWADNPECNLYNRASLPAVPFRTDRWER